MTKYFGDKMHLNKQKLIIFSSLLLFVFLSCSNEEGKSDSNLIKEKKEKILNVEVKKIDTKEFIGTIPVLGTVKPFKRANLGYLAGGKIERIYRDKGNNVSKGDTILVIENASLKGNMLALKAQYELAKVNFEKQEKIYKENVNSEFQFLQAKYQMEQAKAGYDQIKALYNETFIKAPFTGIIEDKYFEEGEIAAPGVPIVTLINSSYLKVEAGVPEKFSGRVNLGDEVIIHFNTVMDSPVESKISYVGSAVKSNNRTFPIEILLSKPDNRIKPEILANVEIIEQKYSEMVIIPDNLISRLDDGYAVFVEKDGIAMRKNVEILSRNGKNVAIKSGLQKGENLIVVGYQNIVDGQKVAVVN